jgi:hypothetical protein
VTNRYLDPDLMAQTDEVLLDCQSSLRVISMFSSSEDARNGAVAEMTRIADVLAYRSQISDILSARGIHHE